MYMRNNRRRNLAPWLQYVLQKHSKTLESLELELVDHNEKEILQQCLTNYVLQNGKLEHLSITAFLTRAFADNLMAAISANMLPLKTLYIKAYSFEADGDFIRSDFFYFKIYFLKLNLVKL